MKADSGSGKLIVRGASDMCEFDTMVTNSMRAFGASGLDENVFRCMNLYSPGYRLDDTRLGILNGEIIGSLCVLKREVVIGGASIPAGCIAGVHVKKKYRNKGYALEILRDAIAYMKKRGYVISLLFSDNHDFYGKLGWTKIPRPLYVLDSDTPLFPVPERYTVKRSGVDEALKQLQLMCPRRGKSYSGYIRRTGAYWKNMNKWYFARKPSCYVAYEGDKPVSVCLLERHRSSLQIHECRWLPGHDESPKNLLRVALAEARRRRLKPVCGVLPETHPTAVKMMLLGGRREVSEELMGLVLDRDGLMRKLAPVFEKRLRTNTSIEDGVYELKVSGLGKLCLKVKKGRVTAGGRGPVRTRCELDSGEFLTRLFGASTFHGSTYTSLHEFFEIILQPQDFIFWNTDSF